MLVLNNRDQRSERGVLPSVSVSININIDVKVQRYEGSNPSGKTKMYKSKANTKKGGRHHAKICR